MSLTDAVLAYACSLGFDRAAVAPMGPPRYGAQFAAWLVAGCHGAMSYLAARAVERFDPERLAPGAASIIVLATNYNPGPACPQHPDQARIARYAWWPDYHDVIKRKLHLLDAFIRARTGRVAQGKVFVDSAPVLERDFAEQAGLGFIGRNTCLITPGLGSWTFLAGLMVPERLEAGSGQPELSAGQRAEGRGQREGCGRCTRCLDACPARAFVRPHVLDARRCISYLTIELRGPIPRDLRPLMGNWVFGCDICQEVCPYNRAAPLAQAGAIPDGAQMTAESAGRATNALGTLGLRELLALDEAGFRARFRGTPVLRAKRRGLVRSACVAAGNSGDASLASFLIPLLADPESLVRGHAAWALGRLGGAEAERALAHALTVERDPWARSELTD